ncbi:MAG: DNA polymerase III subunit delta [Alphaproteobacteria bacterium]|nr:DNA polymerase III subunit delta [Alphaproteobacteria bacterium]
MKWKITDFDATLSKVKAILLYGPDAGGADEYRAKIIKTLGVTKDCLFVMDANKLSDNQEKLFVECCSPSMFGDKKVVVITGVGDADAKIIQELLSSPSLYAKVIVIAGDLGTKSSLRKLYENDTNKDVAVLACYLDEGKSLENLIRSELSSANGIRQITPDAMGYMLGHLGADRGITRGFLQKIILYVNDKHIVDITDVEKCLPDTASISVDEYLYSLTDGNITNTMISLDRLLYSSVAPEKILPMLYKHFTTLLEGVVDKKEPPNLFWKYRDRFRNTVKILSEKEICKVLSRLTEIELQTRIKNMPADLLLRQFSCRLAFHISRLKQQGKE